jgi:hypothetical protein
LAIAANMLPDSDAVRADVGISYAMYAVVAAAMLLMTNRHRLLGMVAISAAVLLPLLSSVDMTALGHVISVAIGFVVMSLFARRRLAAARGRWRVSYQPRRERVEGPQPVAAVAP